MLDALSTDARAVMRAGLVIAILVAASVTAAAQAAGPTTQAQQLTAAEKTFAARVSVVETKLIRLEKTLNVPATCAAAAQIPKKQQQATFGILLSWTVVSGLEMIGPLYVEHARDVVALHLTDPTFALYALALQRLATLVAPLQSAKPTDVCTVIEQWQKHGYEQGGPSIAADLFGLTAAQAAATEMGDDSNPTVKAFRRARTAANARLRALGVAPLPSLTKTP